MAQPETAAGDVGDPADSTDLYNEVAAELLGEDIQEEPEEGDEPTAEDEPEIEEEVDDLPPIDAPVSWDAEAKEKFAELPRDVQEYVAKREGERERFVQSKSQEAAQARQTAISQATAELAQIEQGYAQHFQSLAEQIAPQRPNPALLQSDPMAFYAQQANYENAVAQQRELQQRAELHVQQAQARAHQAAQAEQAEQHRIIVEQFPEYADPTTGPKLRAELSAIAKELGYPDELIGQARASDILAMKKVSDFKAKADKYDALMSKQMAKVRAAKGLPKVAKPGVAVAADQTRQNRAAAAFDRAKAGRNLAEKADGFAEWAKLNGLV